LKFSPFKSITDDEIQKEYFLEKRERGFKRWHQRVSFSLQTVPSLKLFDFSELNEMS